MQFVPGPWPEPHRRIGLPPLTSSSLGNLDGNLLSLKSGGANSLSSGNAATAFRSLMAQFPKCHDRGPRSCAFQKYTLDSASSVLSSVIENTSAALSSIQDVDVALETALLSNNQLLQETAYQALTINNLNQSSVLDLLKSIAFRF